MRLFCGIDCCRAGERQPAQIALKEMVFHHRRGAVGAGGRGLRRGDRHHRGRGGRHPSLQKKVKRVLRIGRRTKL